MKILKEQDFNVPGFLVSGIRCGIKKKEGAKDLALIYSEVSASAAVFTSPDNEHINYLELFHGNPT